MKGYPNMRENRELCFIGVVEKVDEQEAKVCIVPEFCPGLKDVKDFSHMIILYWIHFRDNEKDRCTLLVFPE